MNPGDAGGADSVERDEDAGIQGAGWEGRRGYLRASFGILRGRKCPGSCPWRILISSGRYIDLIDHLHAEMFPEASNGIARTVYQYRPIDRSWCLESSGFGRCDIVVMSRITSNSAARID